MAVTPPNTNVKMLSSAVRKTVLISLAIAAIGFIVSVIVNFAFLGVGLIAGTLLGALNLRLMDSKVAKAKYEGTKMAKKGIAIQSAGRLLGVTGVILGSGFISVFLAIGILLGIVIFQAVLLLNMLKNLNSSGAF